MVAVEVIFGAAAVAAIGIPAAIAYFKKKKEDAEYGGYFGEEKASEKEASALFNELRLEENEAGELRQAMNLEQGETVEDQQISAAEMEAEKAESVGNVPAAKAAEKKAEQLTKLKNKRDTQILKLLEKIRGQHKKELTDLKKAIKPAQEVLKKMREENQTQTKEFNEQVTVAAEITQKIQRNGMSLAYVNRLISRHKAGSVFFKFTVKAEKEIEEHLKKGVSAQVVEPEIKQIEQKIRAKYAQEKTEEAGLAGLFAGTERELQQTQKEVQQESAEEAMLRRKKALEQKVEQYDKKIGKELEKLANTFQNVIKTESKNKNVHNALTSQILVRSQKQFAAVKGLIKIFRSQTKNIRVRSIAFTTIYNFLSRIIIDCSGEEAQIRANIRAIPNQQIAASIIKRLDTALGMAKTIKQQMLVMKQELQVLQLS